VLGSVLLLGLAAAAEAQEAQPAADVYFTEPASWTFRWGTDTAFNLSNLDAGSTNESNDGTTSFDRLWLRLYGRLLYKDEVELVVDLFSSDARDPSVFGLYARIQPSRHVGARVGLIPLVVGGWQDRAYPHRQPLVNQPLLSQYLFSLRTDSVPADVEELVSQRGAGARSRFSLGAAGSGDASTIYYEHCWDVGVEAFGQVGGLRYRLAVIDGTPGSARSRLTADSAGAGLAARLTYRFGEGLRVGGSWSRGPYLKPDVAPVLPAGTRVRDFRQELYGADFRVKKGLLELNGEYALNRYGTPFVNERLRTHGYYGEAALTLRPGLTVAARRSGLVFADVTGAAGRRRRWEWDATRLEAGAAYRIADDHLAFKAVYQRTRVDAVPRRLEQVYAAQLAVSY
jgi:hypothetical protein